ncbi:hypothetical protein AAH678_24150 [Sodalis endosymbiont of Spalangia cameroni]|uniref:hypothetical protein n=1 Tax=Sodalis praecaptivus TaxID=1239307 RepID=UPI0031F9E07C
MGSAGRVFELEEYIGSQMDKRDGNRSELAARPGVCTFHATTEINATKLPNRNGTSQPRSAVARKKTPLRATGDKPAGGVNQMAAKPAAIFSCDKSGRDVRIDVNNSFY